MISPRSLPRDEKSFTLVELMMVILIMGVIMGALVMVLGVGEQATGIGSAKVDLQSDVKTLVDWITSDIRQAKIQYFSNNTTTDYLKFNLWQWNDTTHNQSRTDYYVEYEFDSGNQTLYRRYINDTMPDDCIAEDADDDECKIRNQWNFTDVIMSPFYAEYINETSNSVINSTLLLNNRRIIVAIKKGKTVRNRPLNFTMVEEIRIRNE